MRAQIQLNERATYMILQRLVEVSKGDIRRYKKMLAKNPEWMVIYQRHDIKRDAIDACLFLEWVKKNFST